MTEKEIFRWELLPSFLRLLLINVLRPSALTAAIFNFVEDQMGSKFVKAGTYDLREVLEESTAKQPLVFILSPGKYKYRNFNYTFGRESQHAVITIGSVISLWIK